MHAHTLTHLESITVSHQALLLPRQRLESSHRWVAMPGSKPSGGLSLDSLQIPTIHCCHAPPASIHSAHDPVRRLARWVTHCVCACACLCERNAEWIFWVKFSWWCNVNLHPELWRRMLFYCFRKLPKVLIMLASVFHRIIRIFCNFRWSFLKVPASGRCFWRPTWSELPVAWRVAG